MKRLIKQEVYKLTKQHVFFRQTLFICFLIIGMAAAVKFGKLDFMPLRQLVITRFNSSWLIVFYLVYLASQIFSQEFRYGTIKNLVVQDHTRWQIFVSKGITLIGYSLYLSLVACVVTFATTLVWFPQIHFTSSLLQAMAANLIGSYIGMWLFASLTLLISLFVKNDSLAGMFGIVAYFLASMVAGLQFAVLDRFSWLRFNPFNMLNLANQLMVTQMEKLTHLSTSQLLIGNLGYIVVFLILAKLIFDRKTI